MNRGIGDLQSPALPLGYVAVVVANCATQGFSFGKNHGAGDEIRTRYLHLGKVALCQMSYARIRERKMVPPVGVEPTTRGFSVRCSTN